MHKTGTHRTQRMYSMRLQSFIRQENVRQIQVNESHFYAHSDVVDETALSNIDVPQFRAQPAVVTPNTGEEFDHRNPSEIKFPSKRRHLRQQKLETLLHSIYNLSGVIPRQHREPFTGNLRSPTSRTSALTS